MKLLILILILIINIVKINCQSNVTSTAYALWNENGNTAVIGMIELPNGQNKALYSLNGYVHLESNQMSTFNYLTNIISFIAIGSSGDTNVYYLYQYYIQTNECKFIRTYDSDEYSIFSIASSQNDGITGENDLFVSFNSIKNIIYSVGYINAKSNYEPVQISTIQGKFASAAFNMFDNSYTVYSTFGTEYKLSNYSVSGQLVNSKTIYPQSGYTSPSSAPYSLTFMPTYQDFVFALDFSSVPILFTFNGDQMQIVMNYKNIPFKIVKSYAIASAIKSQTNTDEIYYQFALAGLNSKYGQNLLNVFNQWGYIDTYSSDILPVNMWCIDI